MASRNSRQDPSGTGRPTRAARGPPAASSRAGGRGPCPPGGAPAGQPGGGRRDRRGDRRRGGAPRHGAHRRGARDPRRSLRRRGRADEREPHRWCHPRHARGARRRRTHRVPDAGRARRRGGRAGRARDRASASCSTSAPKRRSSSRSSTARLPTVPACDAATSSAASTAWTRPGSRSPTWRPSCEGRPARRCSSASSGRGCAIASSPRRARGRRRAARGLGARAGHERGGRPDRAVLAGRRRAARGTPSSAALETGVGGLVLDLRGNPGGFVERSTRGRVGLSRRRRGLPGAGARRGAARGGHPAGRALAVDVRSSCSSTTPPRAAPRSSRRRCATTIAPRSSGEQTFGTGTVLNTFDLSDGSALRVGVLDWLTPDGEAVFRVGLRPDHEVEDEPGSAQPASGRAPRHERHRAVERRGPAPPARRRPARTADRPLVLPATPTFGPLPAGTGWGTLPGDPR